MNTLRIGGIASGLDTDQIVRDLMRIETMKADRLYQERQITEWKKEQYRDLINKIRVFRDKYFDLLNPESNMMSATALKKISTTFSVENILTAVASSDALLGRKEIEIKQLATAACGTSSGGVTALRSSEGITGDLTVVDGKNEIQINLNGVVKKIIVTAGTYTNDNLDFLQAELQGKIDAAFGWDENSRKINVDLEGNKLKFKTTASVDELAVFSKTYDDTKDILTQLKIESGASNRLNLSNTMGAISARLEQGPFAFDADHKITFTLNGETIEIFRDDTLRAVLHKINASAAGVTLNYSSFNDKFTLQSKTTGRETIQFDDAGGNFLEAIGIKEITPGQNLEFTIDGSEIASRPGNTFTVDGVTYTANATGKVTMTASVDVEGIYETIESFLNDYNSLIADINAKLREEHFRGFPPLTDEQKEGMSEREIELWEEKAKSGLLRGDPPLANLLQKMREALYAKVGELHLTEIGITTSNNYEDQGKLVLKEGGHALRTAIETNPTKIADLFTGRLEGTPGLAHRLNDVLNDNIRTIRDNNGRKGILLERAGIEGDASQYNNYYDRQIAALDKHLGRVNEMLARREEQYYRQFIAMEKILQQLYTQSDWLTMQLGQFQSF